jgi:hypothetical protein
MITELISLKHRYIAFMTANIPDDLSDLMEEMAEFVTYPDVAEWEANWSQYNVAFLREVGLPASAPTMIEFRSPADVNSKYVYIGFNNYGDRIAVVKATGNVAYIDHDSNDRIEYINRDAISLFRSICAFADQMKGTTGFTDKLTAFDPQAIQEGRWWEREYTERLNRNE